MPPKPQLTLKEKIAMANDLKKGMTEAEASKKYGCGKGTIYRVKKESDKLLEMDENLVGNKKRKISTKFEDLEMAVIEWINMARDNNCVVTGPIIQKVASKLAKNRDISEETFKASNGWLQNFKARHHLISKLLQGERADAPVESAEKFKERLPELLSSYEPKDIYNADEVGLFCWQVGRRTYTLDASDNAGTKQSKKRISILLVAAMDGHLEKMVVINNARCPRAFKAINNDLQRLPSSIIWKWNKKAWMTTAIFSEWLCDFDKKMQREERHVILFVDNFTAHEAASQSVILKNVRIEFLPPNCTSIVQPVDQGVGNTLKIRYRKFLVEHMANMVLCGKQPEEGVDLLRSCIWLARAFNSLNETETVVRCFYKAGFTKETEREAMTTSPPSLVENIDEAENQLLLQEAEVSIPPRVEYDELLDSEKLDDPTDTADDCEEGEEMSDQPTARTIRPQEARNMLTDLEQFLISNGMHEDANWAHKLCRKMTDMCEKRLTQSKLTDFF